MKNSLFRFRALSVLLTLIILATSLTFGTGAADDAMADSEIQTASTGEESTAEVAPDTITPIPMPEGGGHTITEVVSRREENIKHFDLGYGNYKAISYSNPVHRKDTNGVWQDIDNRLYPNTDSTAYATSDGRTTFASNTSSSTPLVTISENGYMISMTPVFVNSGSNMSNNATVKPNAQANIANHEPMEAPTFTDAEAVDDYNVSNTTTVTYSNVYGSADIEYVLSNNDIKENIILEERANSYEYYFALTFSNLYAELSYSGDIIFYDDDTDEAKYRMPAPYMYDADGNYSYDAQYEVQISGKVCAVKLTASADWINDEDRSFPVTIDPSLSQITYAAQDASVMGNKPTTNYGSTSSLVVSTVEQIAYIKMNLPTNMPDKYSLSGAYLNMRLMARGLMLTKK